MKTLKVWGGNLDGRARGLVAAATKKRAVEMLQANGHANLSRHYFDGYWSETGNVVELSIATEEGIWAVGINDSCREASDYKRLG